MQKYLLIDPRCKSYSPTPEYGARIPAGALRVGNTVRMPPTIGEPDAEKGARVTVTIVAIDEKKQLVRGRYRIGGMAVTETWKYTEEENERTELPPNREGGKVHRK